MNDGKKRNLYVEFQQHSQDFILLLSEKARVAGRSKSAAEELSTLEFYHDGVDAIFKEYEKELHIARLRGATDHALLAMAEEELRKVYNELFRLCAKHHETIIYDLLKKTMIVSKKEMADLAEKDLNFKVPDETYERNRKATEHIRGDNSGQGNREDSQRT